MVDKLKDFAVTKDGSFAGAEDFARLLELRPCLDLDSDKKLLKKDPLRQVQDRWRAEIKDLFALIEPTTTEDNPEEKYKASEAEILTRLGKFKLRLSALMAQFEDVEATDFINPDEYLATKRNKGKMAQDIFSPEFAFQDLADADVAEAILDPAKINLALLKRLGIYELAGSPKSNLELAKNCTPAIDHLKTFLAGLKPIRENYIIGEEDSYFRLYEITYGTNAGKILGTTNPQTIDRRTQPSIKSFFITDVYNQNLRLKHIDHSINSEIGKLQRLKRRIRELWIAAENEISEQEYCGKAEVLDQEIEEYNDSIDSNRVSIAKKLPRITSLKDSRGRKNPSAIQAQIVSVATKAEKRLKDLLGIKAYVSKDAAVMEPMIKLGTEKLRKLYDEILAKFTKFKSLSKTPITQADYFAIRGNFMRAIEDLETINLEPFRSFAADAIEAIRKIIEKIDSLTESEIETSIPYENFKQEIIDLFVSLKLAKLYCGFARLEQELYDASSLNRYKTLELLEGIYNIRNQFDSQRILTEVRPEKVDKFKIFYQKFNKIKALLKYFLGEVPTGQIPSPELQEEVYAKLKESFAELLEQLSPNYK